MTGPIAEQVLVIGESLIDIVTREGAAAVESVGGSPANVALGLGRLGLPVRLRTALGDDVRGTRIAAHLAASGVEVDPESFAIERTSTATARISPRGDARYDFDIDWRLPRPIDLGRARIVHVGSIGCFIEPGATSVRDAVSGWADRALLTFDPNIRPTLTGGRDAALAVVDQLAALSDVVKLSDEDAAWLFPGASTDEVLDRFLSLGARIAAVTLGGEGAVLASASARVALSPRRVRVHDTVGAGDTFMASLVADLARGRLGSDSAALTASGERAVAAAAITVGRVGADLPTSSDVQLALSGTPT